MATILLTGTAGFIGSSVAKRLLERGDRVIGIDSLNDYYDVNLKKARLSFLESRNFRFNQIDITDYDAIEKAADERIDKVVHLAAQAGVRYSIENPFSYQETNNKGTLNLLELARHKGIKDFIFASSSSVYGGLTENPFREGMNVDKPISLYAATKRNGELMCYTYHHLYGIRSRCLRFFTVYGPFGRPDMALFKFTKSILEGREIEVYNHGKMKRDFTYIDDIRDGTIAAIDNGYEYEIFNLAAGNTVELMDFINCLEKHLGRKAKKRMMDIQPGDVPETSGDISKARNKLRYEPKTGYDEGIRNFVDWYRDFYKV